MDKNDIPISPAESTADRRVYPRSPVVVREAKTICGMDVFFGYALNVSRSGLFIASSKLRNKGERFTIEFSLQGLDRGFKCEATVIWNRPYRSGNPLPPGYGLRFEDLSEEDASIIDAWVAKTAAIQ